MWMRLKIEEIRKQPEHIRLRYVIGCVFISMAIITVLWVFSLKTSFDTPDENPFSQQDTVSTQETPKSENGGDAPSLNDWIKK